MKTRKLISKTLSKIARYRFLRNHLVKLLDKRIHNYILEDDDYLKSVQLKNINLFQLCCIQQQGILIKIYFKTGIKQINRSFS